MEYDKFLVERTENLVRTAGPFGLYQKLFIAVVQLQSLFVSPGFFVMSYGILKPTLICNAVSYNASVNSTALCDILEHCDNYTTILPYGYKSLSIDWPDLIPCGDRSDKMLFLLSAAELFGGAANLAAGYSADAFGRKPVILVGSAVGSVAAIIGSFSPNFLMFAIFFCIMRVAAQLNFINGSLCSEYTLGKNRLIMNFGMNWCLAVFFNVLIAYTIKNWRYHQLVGGLIGIPVFLAYSCFTESPRWLMAHQKYDRLTSVLNKIAKINGNKVRFNADEIRAELSNHTGQPIVTVKSHKAHFLETLSKLALLLKTRRLRIIALEFVFIAFMLSLFVASILYNLGDLFSSPYISMAFFACFRVWIPFFIIGIDYIFPGFNRKSFLYLGFACVLIPLTIATTSQTLSELGIGNRNITEIVMSFSVLFAISTNFGMLFFAFYQLEVEVYPTIVRNAALAVTNLAYTVGGMVGPQTVRLQNVWRPLQYIVINATYVLCFLISIKVLPETKNKPLPDSIQDLEAILS